MHYEDRLLKLREVVVANVNDEFRYKVGEKVRELGYLDVTDFVEAKPREAHLAEVERLVADSSR